MQDRAVLNLLCIHSLQCMESGTSEGLKTVQCTDDGTEGLNRGSTVPAVWNDSEMTAKCLNQM